MKKTLLLALAAVGTAATLFSAPARITPHEYVLANGRKVNAELGELAVPENRTKPGSRTITLRFVRFKATGPNPGAPIVYLAGGPGHSAIETLRGGRFAIAAGFREFGDVIALDQRGIGRSEPDTRCTEQYTLPAGEPLDRAKGGALAAEAMRKCAARLRASGIDLAAYNTRESAADIDDLRKAIGADKIVLWGISYGTHVASAVLRYYPDTVERAILAGIEGPDDTYKLPNDHQMQLEYLAWLSAEDAKNPDLIASIRDVMRDLETSPKTVALTNPENGQTTNFVVGKFDLQLVLADMLYGPEAFAGLPDFIARLERGDWTSLALFAAPRRVGTPGSAMAIAMDCASGASAGRRQRIAEEAKHTLLGDAVNAPFPEICAGLNVPDLGDEFRAPLASNVRALMFSGALDGRTPPRQGDELRMRMPNAQHVVIAGAGHGDPVLLSTPKILQAIKTFMHNEPLRERYVSAAPVPFTPLRKIVHVPDDILSSYVGTYRVDQKTTRRVLKAGSLLYTIRDQGPPFALRPISETQFFYETTGATTVTFERDDNGRVMSMMFKAPDGTTQRGIKEP